MTMFWNSKRSLIGLAMFAIVTILAVYAYSTDYVIFFNMHSESGAFEFRPNVSLFQQATYKPNSGLLKPNVELYTWANRTVENQGVRYIKKRSSNKWVFKFGKNGSDFNMSAEEMPALVAKWRQ